MNEIKLEKFEGPLDLLLQLIELEKLNITEVSLSKVTEQFLLYLDKLEEERSEELAEFLVIATKLVYMKSRVLLPYLNKEEDNGPSLADQLKLYQSYVEASKKMNVLWQQNKVAYGRIEPPIKSVEFKLPENSAAKNLHKAMEKLVAKLRPPTPLPKITIDRAISVKQKVESIWNALKEHKKVSFRDLLGSSQNKTDVIVSFLALLELMRDQKAYIHQDDIFGDMEVKII